jgi:uncharacterized protein YozE (UPF0346 family)
MKKGFKRWLIDTYKAEKTRRGDLARDVMRDGTFPRRSEYGIIREYLQEIDASPAALRCFDALWAEFVSQAQKADTSRERDVESWLKEQVEDMGGLFWKFTSPGNDGVPDRIAMFQDGRLVFVELKARAGQLSKVQRYQLQRLIRMNQQVCIVRGRKGAEAFMHDMRSGSISCVDYGADGDDLNMDEGWT